MLRFRLRPVATVLLFVALLALMVYDFGPWAGACALAMAVIAFVLSALAYQEFYGSARTAIRFHWSAMMGTTRGFQKIEDGTTTLPKGAAGPVLGPRLVIVAPYNAVVLERGAQQTGIRGPEIFKTGAFEFVKRIYDLRPRQESLTFRGVLTADGLLTTVNLSTTYSIAISRPAKLGLKKITGGEKGILQNIDQRMPDWQQAVRSAIERSVRDVVRARKLAHLMKLPNQDELGEAILSLARARVEPWGILLDQLRVESLRLTDEVTDATTESWVAGQEQKTQNARARSLAQWVTTMADALAAAAGRGLSNDAVYREAWCRAIERMSKSIPEGLVLEPDINEVLITLKKSAGLIR